jgi:hypothetical protein
LVLLGGLLRPGEAATAKSGLSLTVLTDNLLIVVAILLLISPDILPTIVGTARTASFKGINKEKTVFRSLSPFNKNKIRTTLI